MDALKTGVYDVVKYSIINRMNTGDKTLDNLLNTLCLTLLASITFSKIHIIVYLFRRFLTHRCLCRKTSNKLDESNHNYYKHVLNSQKVKKFTWDWDFHTQFYTQLYYFLTNNVCSDERLYVSQDGKSLTESISYKSGSIKDKLSSYLKLMLMEEDIVFPIYISNTGAIGMDRNSAFGVSICYTNSEVCDEFLNLVMTYKTKQQIVEEEDKKVKRTCRIQIGSTVSQTIFPDRTFNQFISLYKPKIMSLLQNFTDMNDFESKLPECKRRFGSYNLGFMLHGKPGTGKTSFIKALCNYLDRDALVVDLRTVKTHGQFESIFSTCHISKTIFVFEEFDCVQGVFDRSVLDNSEAITKLNESYKQLLGIRATSEKGSDNSKLDDELNSVKVQINNLENALTVDTMLKVLDGMFEQRNRVIIATTNEIDKIDSALLREGRFDLKIKLDEFTNEETHELLRSYFEDSDLSYLTGKEFSKQYTPVQIINFCRQYKDLKSVVDFLLYKKE